MSEVEQLKRDYNYFLKRIKKGWEYLDNTELSREKQDYYIKELKKLMFRIENIIDKLEDKGVEVTSEIIQEGFNDG